MTQTQSGLLKETLDLQRFWSSANTPGMERRGIIVRREIPAVLSPFLADLSLTKPVLRDLDSEGSDGIGRKSEVPWTRIYSHAFSASPREGWYLVYLFAADGSAVYLTLDHASTDWTGIEFAIKPEAELAALTKWARDQLHLHGDIRDDLLTTFDLKSKRKGLGESYVQGAAYALRYESEAMPDDKALYADLGEFLDKLAILYELQETNAPMPGREPMEVLDAIQSASLSAGRPFRRTRAQGRGLSVNQRKAIEEHAVRSVVQHLRSDGWKVRDVGSKESYDLDATRSGRRIYVEVKGTTSLGEAVVLTANEVQLHRSVYPDNALFVVHSIVLEGDQDAAKASGGVVVRHAPWLPADSSLSAISYRFEVPAGGEILPDSAGQA